VTDSSRPGHGIACACSISDRVRSLGLETRAGLHTGELERLTYKVGGVAVLIGARIAARARASEVLVSRTLRELVQALASVSRIVDRTHCVVFLAAGGSLPLTGPSVALRLSLAVVRGTNNVEKQCARGRLSN
jgi:class 3 adenylate cyclase